jgi:hypothetical protein
MKKYFIYEVKSTGLSQCIFEEEQSPSEEYLLQGTFLAFRYNEEHETMQIIAEGLAHKLSGWSGAPYSVSVEEAALMLDLSRQRIRALLSPAHRPGKIHALKVSGVWLIQATELITFAALNRPAHRPAASNELQTECDCKNCKKDREQANKL